MISLRDVSKVYDGAAPAVDELSLEIDEGEIVVLVGPSGCGKTTTLKMINRLIEPTSGEILVNGRNVLEQDPVELRRGIGYVIQSIGLLPHRTIRQNIATVPDLLRWERPRTRARVDELAEMLRLDHGLLDRYPGELSGGQRQRVGVARGLAADPPVMLMDEPFGAVDPIIRERLQDQFLEIQRELKKTIVFVTHDVDEAIKMADRIAILNIGAVVEQYDAPEAILSEPASDFVKSFVGLERGLKRLSLIKVADIEVEEGPIVAPTDDVSTALAEMERSGFGWASVVEEGRLLGWVDPGCLEGMASVGQYPPRRFSATVTDGSSLREALDTIVTSRTNVAVVVTNGGRYRGVLTLEKLTRELIA
ncbi:MAG TPA: betaine/proline/choline family ABC transporter ATP-binding protein [Actinomycetota bacterium]